MDTFKSKKVWDQFVKGELDKQPALHRVEQIRPVTPGGIIKGSPRYQVVCKYEVVHTADSAEDALAKARQLNQELYNADMERQRDIFMCHTHALVKQFTVDFVHAGKTGPLPMPIREAQKALDKHGWGGQ